MKLDLIGYSPPTGQKYKISRSETKLLSLEAYGLALERLSEYLADNLTTISPETPSSVFNFLKSFFFLMNSKV